MRQFYGRKILLSIMNPFTALGLAGNLIQFVDFAWKLVAGTREIVISVNAPREFDVEYSRHVS
jgi:hypothetical protein